jgi:hypothetical protein
MMLLVKSIFPLLVMGLTLFTVKSCKSLRALAADRVVLAEHAHAPVQAHLTGHVSPLLTQRP